MKVVFYLLVLIAFTGCGAKSNEEKAMAVITENLKTTLPDFNKYTSLNFGPLGSASLPYEETSQYLNYKKTLIVYRDSMLLLQKMISADSTAPAVKGYRQTLQQLQDSTTAKNEWNKTTRQGYTPEKLFKITHAYTLKDQDGNDKKTESAFFIDEDLTKVVKVEKNY